MLVKWNLTSHIQKPKEADALVVSVSKSGRTWLRVMLNRYISQKYGVNFTVDKIHKGSGEVPFIHYTHEAWEHYTVANLVRRLVGKFVVPDGILKSKPVILMYRDPRDVIVSYYFHRKKRQAASSEAEIGDFIKNPDYGIKRVIEVMNLWRARLSDHEGCHWVSYEDMRKDPLGELKSVVEQLPLGKVDEQLLVDAVEFGSFNKMKQMEKNLDFDNKILQPGDVSDNNSFKVRRGKVGGYTDYLSERDVEWANKQLRGLDYRYGYNP